MNIEPVREILQADGGDIELMSDDGDVVRLRLLLKTASCADCVLPKSMLEEVALTLLRPVNPGLVAVEIEDPRLL